MIQLVKDFTQEDEDGKHIFISFFHHHHVVCLSSLTYHFSGTDSNPCCLDSKKDSSLNIPRFLTPFLAFLLFVRSLFSTSFLTWADWESLHFVYVVCCPVSDPLLALLVCSNRSCENYEFLSFRRPALSTPRKRSIMCVVFPAFSGRFSVLMLLLYGCPESHHPSTLVIQFNAPSSLYARQNGTSIIRVSPKEGGPKGGTIRHIIMISLLCGTSSTTNVFRWLT